MQVPLQPYVVSCRGTCVLDGIVFVTYSLVECIHLSSFYHSLRFPWRSSRVLGWCLPASVKVVPSVGMGLYGSRVGHPKCWDGSLRLPCESSQVLGWVFTASVWVIPSVGMGLYGSRVGLPKCWDGSLRLPCGSSQVLGWFFTAPVWVVPCV